MQWPSELTICFLLAIITSNTWISPNKSVNWSHVPPLLSLFIKSVHCSDVDFGLVMNNNGLCHFSYHACSSCSPLPPPFVFHYFAVSKNWQISPTLSGTSILCWVVGLFHSSWIIDLPGRYVAVMHVGCNNHSSPAPVALKRHQTIISQQQVLHTKLCRRLKNKVYMVIFLLGPGLD